MNQCPYCQYFPLPPGGKSCPACGAPVASPPQPTGNPHQLAGGTRLADGRYTVGRVLGSGGFGITYQGADLLLSRPVAIKELFPDGSVRTGNTLQPPAAIGVQGFAEARTSFQAEAHTLAQFADAGIVKVHDVFEENGTAYLVMEFLTGETLAGRLERGQVPPAEVAGLARRVGQALAVVHGAGLIHRDLKPENLFLTGDGRVVLIDFGSARGFVQGQTVRHTRLVTPGYAAPEQYATRARFGPFTDLYGLGATLYHALTGNPPPGATDRLLGIDLGPLPASVPPGLRQVVEKLLALQVEDRPQTVAEFLRMLDDQAPEQAPGPAPVPAGAPAARPQSGSPWPELHKAPIAALVYIAGGRQLLTAGMDGQVVLWDVAAGAPVQTVPLPQPVTALAFSPDGDRIGVAASGHGVSLYAVPDGRLLQQWKCEHVKHIAVSRNGSLVAVATETRTLVGKLGEEKWSRMDVASAAVVFAHAEPWVACARATGRIELRDAASGALHYEIGELFFRNPRSPMSVAYDDDYIVAVDLWNPSLVRTWSQFGGVLKKFTHHTSDIVAVGCSPYGHYVASAGADHRVCVWDTGTDRYWTSFTQERAQAFAFSPDGRTLAMGCGNQVRFWRWG